MSIILKTLKVFDFLAAMASLLIATAVVAHGFPKLSLIEFLAMRVKISNVLLLGTFGVVWHFTLSALGLYEPNRLSSIRNKAPDLLKATFLGTGILLISSVALPISMIDNLFLFVFWLSVSALMISWRWLMDFVLRRAKLLKRNLRNVVFVGINDQVLQLADRIRAKPELGYGISGFFSDSDAVESDRIDRLSYRWLGRLSQIHYFLSLHPVDEVIVCLPLRHYYTEVVRIVSLCESQGIIVHLSPELFNPLIGRSRLNSLDGLPVVTITTGSLDGYGLTIKRIVDIIGSAILLVLVSPVLIATALVIKATSPGPVLFTQERVGRNKRRFRIYKFRTMVQGADRMLRELEHLNEVDGAAFKIRKDPRITPVGKILRETSIDELPQLFNVLKGDMSLVGPRPLPVRDYENFSEDWHRRRFSVKPGITCLWQISGRSDLDFRQWMELDMSYIDQWSLWLDAKILLRTVPAVLQRRGAS